MSTWKRPTEGTSVEELDEGVTLTTQIKTKPVEYIYTVLNKLDEELLFTFDFTGSSNIRIEGSDNPYKIMISIKPHSTSNELVIRRENIEAEAKIMLQNHWEFIEIDADTLREYEESWDQSIQAKYALQLSTLRASMATATIDPLTPRKDIEDAIESEGFMDGSFLPLCMFLHRSTSDENNQPDSTEDNKLISYRRITQFLPPPHEKIKILPSMPSALDIEVGTLPDVWLMSTLACVVEILTPPSLLANLFPSDALTFSEKGVYKVRLFKGGAWTTLLLDDFFPCVVNGGPVHSKSKSGCLYACLVEKAMAKSHGDYSAIAKGAPYEALIDLTGAPVQCFLFDDPLTQATLANSQFWHSLHIFDLKGHILTVSTDRTHEDDVGVQSGHTFLLKSIITTTSGIQLLKLHDPWGTLSKWTGKWRIGANAWTPKIKKELEYKEDIHYVWMEFHELCTFFSCLNVVIIRRAMELILPWNTASSPVVFTLNGYGTIVAPYFSMTVGEDANVYLTVHQTDDHTTGAFPYIDIGITVLTEEDGQPILVNSCGNTAERQNMVYASMKANTTYTILVTTTGCRLKQFLSNLPYASDDDASLRTRKCMLYIHSEAPITLTQQALPNDSSLMDKGLELAVLGGACMDIVEDALQMYSLKGGLNGISYAALNISESTVRLTTDFGAESVNVCSHRGKLVSSVVILPGELKMLHHICPLNERLPWEAVWDCKVLFYDEEDVVSLSLSDDDIEKGQQREVLTDADENEGVVLSEEARLDALLERGVSERSRTSDKSNKSGKSDKGGTLAAASTGDTEAGGGDKPSATVDQVAHKSGCRCSVM